MKNQLFSDFIFGMKKFLILCVASLTLFGCNSPSTYILTDKNKTATCKVGDYIVVELESNPTTGYDWRPQSFDDKLLKIQGRKYEAANSLTGSPGTAQISFSALEAGTSGIRLEYIRHWEDSPIEIKDFEVKILAN